MPAVYKLVMFIIVIGLVLLVGYFAYGYLHNKIKESRTGWQLAAYSFLLIAINAILLFAGVYLLVKIYGFLADGG